MPSQSAKGFTLIELMIVIAIIGITSLLALNFDFNKKTDIEKRDRIIEKISSMLNSAKTNMSSGKWVLSGTAIINPSQTEVLFSSWGVITRYYSGETIIGTGETFLTPFWGDASYALTPLYYTDKTLTNTSSLTYPVSILLDTQGNISFSGSDATSSGSVLVSLQAGYQGNLKTFEFDRRGFGRISIK